MYCFQKNLWRFAATKLLATLVACGGVEPIDFHEGDRVFQSQAIDEDASATAARWKLNAPQTVNLQVDTKFGKIKQLIELQQIDNTLDMVQQENRPLISDRFTQGHDGDSIFENFAVSEDGFFDLLIVIDDSSSMTPYQDRLSKNLSSILRHIAHTNWQIAVATTSSSCLNTARDGRKILTRAAYLNDQSGSEQAFLDLILTGESGNSTEKGILYATKALNGECNGEIQPWLRPASSRAVLLVTDEHNCGSAINEGCVGEDYETSDYFFQNAPENVTVHGLLLLEEPPLPDMSNPNDPNYDCVNSGGYEGPPSPSNYLDLINRTGGLVRDICQADYDVVLEEMSASVGQTINFNYALRYPPIDGSEYILIDGRQVVDYTISGNILTVERTLDMNSESLSISYLHSPINRFSSLSLSEPPDVSSLLIYEDDKLIAPENFLYDINTETINFVVAPKDRSQVDVVYRKRGELPKVFQTKHEFIPESIQVFVDGKPVSVDSVQAENRKILLSEAPKDNATIEMLYERPGDRITQYIPLTIDFDKLEAVGAYDLKSKQEIDVSLTQDNKIKIDGKDVWQNREIVVWYDLAFTGEELSFAIPLKKGIDIESLSIDTPEVKDICSSNFQVNQNNLILKCIDDSPEKINISYKYSTDYTNSFRLLVDPYRPKKWIVKVNKQEIKQFQVFGNTVVIQRSTLPAGSDVMIEARYLD